MEVKNVASKKIEIIIMILSATLILTIPQYGVFMTYILFIAYLFGSKNRKVLQRSIGLSRPKKIIKLIAITILLGIFIEVMMETLMNPLIDKLTFSKIDLSKVRITNIKEYLTWTVIGFVMGGFLEEIIFRGFLITRISGFFKQKRIGEIFSLLITSILFGLCHLYQGWSGVISTGITGLILAIIFLVFKKNLWYSILTHGFINLTAITILYLGYYEELKSLIFYNK